ncbi:hypothetical protein K034_4387, partial [Acinetobacter baumannii 42057_3]
MADLITQAKDHINTLTPALTCSVLNRKTVKPIIAAELYFSIS